MQSISKTTQAQFCNFLRKQTEPKHINSTETKQINKKTILHFLIKQTKPKIIKSTETKREKKFLVPESVNSQENSRIKTSMADDFSLTHLHSLRHPTEEGEISPEIEIDEFAHKIP